MSESSASLRKPSVHPHFEGLTRDWVEGKLPLDYREWSRVQSEKNCSEVWLTLHGYQQTGAYLFEKLKPAVDEDQILISPNAPFPVPMKEPTGKYRLGFSWYFYNPDSDAYFIDMEIAIHSMVELLKKKGLESTPKRLIGFSQGGYLAPFLAERLKNVIQVVGIGAEVLGQELNSQEGGWHPAYRVDGVQGAEDPIVTLERSRKSFEQAQWEKGKKRFEGEYCVIPQMGHGLKEAGMHELRRLLRLGKGR